MSFNSSSSPELDSYEGVIDGPGARQLRSGRAREGRGCVRGSLRRRRPHVRSLERVVVRRQGGAARDGGGVVRLAAGRRGGRGRVRRGPDPGWGGRRRGERVHDVPGGLAGRRGAALDEQPSDLDPPEGPRRRLEDRPRAHVRPGGGGGKGAAPPLTEGP